MSIIRRDGFDFGFDPGACTGCPSHCCRGKSGRVWLNQQEIFQICNFLNMNAIDFIQKHTDRMGNRLSIKERHSEHDFECVFLEGSQKKCSIYEVRPTQCRRFPFWNYFRKHKDQAIKECPGIRG
jgi:Fe-S-cluster containining protein